MTVGPLSSHLDLCEVATRMSPATRHALTHPLAVHRSTSTMTILTLSADSRMDYGGDEIHGYGLIFEIFRQYYAMPTKSVIYLRLKVSSFKNTKG